VHSRLTAAQGYTTLELKVAYHKAMTESTGIVRAEGWVVTMGRRAAFAEAHHRSRGKTVRFGNIDAARLRSLT
jgi:acyl-coenzyme A thioesterase PaaI-like protein